MAGSASSAEILGRNRPTDDSTAAIMAEIAAVAPAYGGISHARLERGEQLHWPVPTPEHPGTPILHRDCFTRSTGVLTPCEYLPPEELPDEEFPFYLTTRALDPIAKIPEYKVCAVRVEAVD